MQNNGFGPTDKLVGSKFCFSWGGPNSGNIGPVDSILCSLFDSTVLSARDELVE